MHMLTKLAFHEQQIFALFGINNSDFFAVSEKKTFQLIRHSRLEEATKKEQDFIEERNQIYWNVYFLGDKIINTSYIEGSNQNNSRANDDAYEK